MLAVLREHFQDQLFVRSGAFLYPTDRAKELYPRMVSLFKEIEGLTHQQTFEPVKETRIFNVGLLDIDIVTFISPVLEVLRHRAPGIRLNCWQLPNHFYQELKLGKFDFCLYPTTEKFPDFSKIELCNDCFVYIAHSQSNFAKRALDGETLSEKELRANLSVAPTTPVHNVDNTELGLFIEDVHNKFIRPNVYVPFFSVIPYLIEHDAVSYVPYQTAVFLQKYFPIEILGRSAKLDTYRSTLIWSKLHDQDPAHQWLRSLFVSTASKFPSVESCPRLAP